MLQIVKICEYDYFLKQEMTIIPSIQCKSDIR